MSSSPIPQFDTGILDIRTLDEDLLLAAYYHRVVERKMKPGKEFPLPISLKRTFPESWNFYFQLAFSQKYGPNADLDEWKFNNLGVSMPVLEDEALSDQEILLTTKVLLKAERSLAALAAEKFSDNNFETAWTALETESRKKLVLEGLVRAALHAPELSRLDCPEMCLFSLAGDRRADCHNERDLLDLLKDIMSYDFTETGGDESPPYVLYHAAVLREYIYTIKGDGKMRAFGRLRILQRNLYITQALIEILKAYSGVPHVRCSLQEEWDAKVRGRGYRCSGCYSCGATPNNDAVTLSKCSGCHSVTYCSKDCQRHDWGGHKKLCGTRG
ncbi:hypothetical protein B0H16DRAFT_1891151 [Mycena metata]|uniref:MYND-type domain-containing protein n=1 Tax=Mycena metata TaxID=1033252 RepID=A0AAD7MZ00_9AGAR|nr:hypothetical protein B0H16DRAFT_1891151 [Mycena metata]